MTFMEGVVHYGDKVSKARSFVNDNRIETCMKKMGVSKDELKYLIDINDSKLSRSEERRGVKECRRECISRWSPYH